MQNIKFTIRSLLKNKTTAIINMVGLSVAAIVSFLLFSVAIHENRIDHSLKNLDEIYVLSESEDPALSKPIADWIVNQVPELGTVTLCNYEWSPQVFLKTPNQTNYKIQRLLVADANYFKVFQFSALYGNPGEALTHDDQIVLTESLAKKIFGNENPVGKSVAYNSTYLNVASMQVGAVIKDLPQNSSWEFEAVLPIKANLKLGWYQSNYKSWGAFNYCAFGRKSDATDMEVLHQHLAEVDRSDVPEDMREDTEVSLTPFREAYFNLPSIGELKHGNRYVNRIIQAIALLILLLACVNYISMVTAQREKWNKTIGIVKSLGSSKNKIVRMVMTESTLTLLVVLGIVVLGSPLLLKVLGNSLITRIGVESLFSAPSILTLASIFLFTWIITGIVPGYLLSRHKPSLLLKRLPGVSSGKSYLKNGMLIFQFSVTIILLASIFFVERQNRLVTQSDPGFQKDHIIVASTNKYLQTKIQTFKNEVQAIPEVVDFTFVSEPLGAINNNYGRQMSIAGTIREVGFAAFWVSPNFFDFFGIKLKEGNTFQENSTAKKDFIFNEKAIQEFGIENIEDAQVVMNSGPEKGHVIGVAENFNFKSLHIPIEAAGFQSAGPAEDIAYFKLNTAGGKDFQETIKQLEKVWNELSPDYPFEYSFLDRSWQKLYQHDLDFQRLIKYATLISILLSCIGLIGLSHYIMEMKTKEIGIRKVNGARISEVMTMLNKDFIKWVAIAFVIATPIAWYAMNRWLENFAYKTTLSWWIFALAGMLALGIALLTVSWQSWKAATRNPVEALRYE